MERPAAMPSARTKLLVNSAGALAIVAFGGAAYMTTAKADVRDLSVSSQAPLVATPSFADLIQRVAPAVVSIDVTRRGGREDAGLSSMQGQPFQFMFPFSGQGSGSGSGAEQGDGSDDDDQGALPHAMPFGGGGGGGGAQKVQVTGSGFIISPDGYVVTNNHVVEGAGTITVRLADQRALKARLVGRDPATDLAVLKIDGGQFSYVSFEDKARPRVGDWVVAVGNPYDLGGTATAGIVSALARENVSGSSFVDYMQIDAPINKGNSGGPTFDTSGRVVGVNSAIYSPSGGSVGIGFAIPADVAEAVTHQLIAHGKVARGYIGATIQNISPDIASSLGIPAKSGALVAEVTSDGPAARAGLQPGDVITRVDGAPITSASGLTQKVAFDQAGSDIRLDVLRDGRTVNLTVRSGLRPSEAQLASGAPEPSDDSPLQGQAKSPDVLGMRLGRLSDQTRQAFGLAGQRSGVVVEGVLPDTDAADKGLQPGDVITKAGSRALSAPTDLAAAATEARKAGRSEVLLLVSRNGRSTFIPLKISPSNG